MGRNEVADYVDSTTPDGWDDDAFMTELWEASLQDNYPHHNIEVCVYGADRRGIYDPFRPTPTWICESYRCRGWKAALQQARRLRDEASEESHRYGEVYGPVYHVVVRRIGQ